MIPIDVALSRFREGLERPDSLRSGATSLDDVVKRVVEALEASDTLAFAAMAVNLAEYAWLYYPTTLIAQPPYELPPALAWFQLQGGNRKGVLRALRDLGGRDLGYRGFRCADQPMVEAENRIWTGCTVTMAPQGAASIDLELFSAVLERDGRFLVLSFENDF